MKLIKLTQGKFAKVDDVDFNWLNQWSWQAHTRCGIFYARRAIHKNGKTTTIIMHRLILGLTDPKIYGEHRNGDGLNNQRHNLRTATSSQNQMNNRTTTGASKYKGVTKNKKRKWLEEQNNEERDLLFNR